MSSKKLITTVLLSSLLITISLPSTALSNQNITSPTTETPSDKFLKQIEYFKIGVWEENISFEWKVNKEDNIKEYVLEFSLNAEDFTELGREKSNGISEEPIRYEKEIAFDKLSTEGYYRLKQIDANGNVAYTQVKYLQLPSDKRKDISLTFYPSPEYKRKQTLRLEKLEDYQKQIEITDHRNYRIKSTTIDKGRNEAREISMMLDGLNLPSGIYYIKVYSNNDKVVRKLLVK